MTSLLRILCLTTLALSLSSCANKKNANNGYGGTSDSDFVAGSAIGTPLPERQEGVSFLGSNVDRNRFSPVQFEFDSFSVPSSERAKIEQVANFLRGASTTVIIAGFTDERGTPEYNRGLGERRAQSVRQALISAGADASKLQTVSFGAEMPADPASSEAAFARNRRAEFGVVR